MYHINMRLMAHVELRWVLIGSHLKLLPEALLDLISGLCQLAELSYPNLDLRCVNAGGVQRLQETQFRLTNVLM